jgi:hypothetical protein
MTTHRQGAVDDRGRNPDLQVAQMSERGLAVATVDAEQGANRRATVIDPEGNRVTFFKAWT